MRFSYSRLNDGSTTDDDFVEKEPKEFQPARPSRNASVNILFISSVAMMLGSLVNIWWSYSHPVSDMRCAKQLSPWSSMWDAVEFWEGSPTNYFNHSSIYRGPPTPERERAWRELWHYPGMPVSAAGVVALNKSGKAEYVQTVDSDPANPTYGSMVEVFHQLHCLNLIRQYTWFLSGNYDINDESILYPHDFADPVGGRMHVDHCIEALRIDMMCYGDITPVLIKHDENRATGRIADFSVHHKCRNFDRIRDWIKDHGVHIPYAKGFIPIGTSNSG